jgi:hypothetical protein
LAATTRLLCIEVVLSCATRNDLAVFRNAETLRV